MRRTAPTLHPARLRRICVPLLFLAFWCPLVAGAKEVPLTLNLRILNENWGKAGVNDIHAVCLSAGNEFAKHFPGRVLPPITVGNNSKLGPISLYARGPAGETQILLNTGGRAWSQYSYQFAHELCHELCNYRNAENPQMWFEESLCETASIFVIRKMASTWKTNAPYPNWRSYSNALAAYEEDHLKKTPPLGDRPFPDWFRAHEAQLQKERTNRPLNQVVAVNALLPLFLKEPHRWETISYLNQWDPSMNLTFREYLIDWKNQVPQKHKKFVEKIAAKFELTCD